MNLPNLHKGVKIPRITTLETAGRPELNRAIARVYEEIGGAPPTSTLDLLTSLVTLTTHAAVAHVQRDSYSDACRLGVDRAIGDTLALLAGSRSANEFELGQKALATDIIRDQRTAVYWALISSIHSDARTIFPGRSREDIDVWIGQQHRAPMN
jgi:hypothetical protein